MLGRYPAVVFSPNGAHFVVHLDRFTTSSSLHTPRPAMTVEGRLAAPFDSDVTTTPALPGYIGIVKEVVPSHANKTIGYNLSLEDDPRPAWVWFFLQDQLKPT